MFLYEILVNKKYPTVKQIHHQVFNIGAEFLFFVKSGLMSKSSYATRLELKEILHYVVDQIRSTFIRVYKNNLLL